MDVETQLRKLELRYRSAATAATAAKAHYLGLNDGVGVSRCAIDLAKESWRRLDERRRTILALMGEVEDLDSGTSR